MAKARRYWLVKSEPDVYSIDDLQRDRQTCWDGVRNYQARNFIRDDMKLGDGVLFHHSNATPPGIVGIAKICREAYPDHTQFDPKSDYHDPKSKPEAPTWLMVDVEFVAKFEAPLELPMLREQKSLEKMLLLQKGQRLSVMPVTESEWKTVLKLAGHQE